MLSDLDFALVNALQLNPRLSWTQVGQFLDVSPSTALRHWTDLVERRLAWTACAVMPDVSRSPISMALVEIRTTSGCRESVADVLIHTPWIINLEYTSGDRDLLLTVVLPTIVDIDRAVAETVTPMAGVIGTRTHIVRHLYQEGSVMNMNVLPATTIDAIKRSRAQEVDIPFPGFGSDLARCVGALSRDARRPATELADELGLPVARVRRLVVELQRSRWCRFRTDFSNVHLGHEVFVYLTFNVRHDQLASIVASLALVPQIRLVVSLVGPANLVVAAWLPTLRDLDALELAIMRAFPMLTAIDRWLVPRSRKRLGHLIDPDGLHAGSVPVYPDVFRGWSPRPDPEPAPRPG